MNTYDSRNSACKTVSGFAQAAFLMALFVFNFGCSENKSTDLAIADSPATNSVSTTVRSGVKDPVAQTQPPQQASKLPALPKQAEAIGGPPTELLKPVDPSGATSTENAGNWLTNTWQGVSDSGSQLTTGSMDWANKTFKSLKDQGLTTAESTSDWLTEDWQNMESWEYKIVNSKPIPENELEAELNRLGKQGWECFSINAGQMFFKKRRESYLRRLPFKDLLRLAPLFNQGN